VTDSVVPPAAVVVRKCRVYAVKIASAEQQDPSYSIGPVMTQTSQGRLKSLTELSPVTPHQDKEPPPATGTAQLLPLPSHHNQQVSL
jgi:hypothetical protein